MRKVLRPAFIVFLSTVIALSSLNLTVYAVNSTNLKFTAVKFFSNEFSSFADSVVRSLAGLLPDRNWPVQGNYTSSNFYTGTNGTVEGDSWLCGYASESIIPDDIESGTYNSAGYSGNLPTNYVTGVMDDQRISAVTLSIGGKTAVFISLDGFGITGTNVREIRERLKAFAANNGIVSINITSSHSHYCIDTLGLGTNIYDLLKFNLVNIITRQPRDYSSTNEKFMNGLFSAAERVVKDSVSSLSKGTLSYGNADIADLISDSRTPAVFDSNVNRIRFVPDDIKKNEIWLVNMGVHPTSLEMGEKNVSADYPGAIVRCAKELAGADVAFYQGAQCAVYSNVSGLGIPENRLGTSDEVNAYGREITQRLIKIQNDEVVALKLNIRHSELYIPIENSFLQLACKMQLINSTVLNTTGKLKDIVGLTEIGYCELGDNLAIGLMPGELSPEIAFGGALSAEQAWNGTTWKYKPLTDMTGGRKLICFGLTNDQIGYIIPDNDFASTYAQLFSSAYEPGNDHYNEMISLGRHTASKLMEGFNKLLNP